MEWTGSELHRKVGKYDVTAKVTRRIKQSGGKMEESTDCFSVPFVIHDDDECSLPVGHTMRHKCHESARCVNTIGSYECECQPPSTVTTASDAWALSLSSSSCPLSSSTSECCATDDCKADFVCPVDPCGPNGSSDCDIETGATCVSDVFSDGSGAHYSCKCPSDLYGNGHVCSPGDAVPNPKVGFDGLPTDATKSANFCGCTKPSVNQCAGFPTCEKKNTQCRTKEDGSSPTCECKNGYVDTPEHGCVDETPPTLKLRCDPNNDGVMKLKQGDNYEECAVDIMDDNAEDLARTLKIAYSEPLPSGCLRKMGSFHVNYSVATPWTDPPFQKVTRTVEVGDLDECKISSKQAQLYCPEAIPKCDTASGAVCKNTIGSYTCECPKCTAGDGFLPISGLNLDDPLTPIGYGGGTGCVDSCKPEIKLAGPNPRVFRACKCSGLLGLTEGGKQVSNGFIKSESGGDRNYDAEVKALIRGSAGAELCATKENAASVTSRSCAYAFDSTPNGIVDLSGDIIVGDPVKSPKQPNMWRVPYNVVDSHGNRADTVWRDVVVEELSFEEYESALRKEFEEEKKKAVDAAVGAALKREKIVCDGKVRALEAGGGDRAKGRNSKCQKCPPPPKCNENFDGKDDNGLRKELRTCQGELSEVRRSLIDRKNEGGGGGGGGGGGSNLASTLEELFPLFLVLLLGSSALGLLVLVLQRAKSVVMGNNKGGKGEAERAAALAKSVTYHSPRHGTGSVSRNGVGASNGAQNVGVATPASSTRSGVFSPGSVGSGMQSPASYTLSPITPSRMSKR